MEKLYEFTSADLSFPGRWYCRNSSTPTNYTQQSIYTTLHEAVKDKADRIETTVTLQVAKMDSQNCPAGFLEARQHVIARPITVEEVRIRLAE